MTAARLDRPDLRVWLAGGLVALALHAAFALRLVQWRDPVMGDEGSEAVLVDLAPVMDQTQTESRQDLAPGPEQQEGPAVPEPPKEEPKQQAEEKVEPLPAVPNAEAVLPKEVEKPIEKPVEPERPPAPRTTAPPRPRPSAAQISSWHRQIAIQLQRHKGYPAAAQQRHESGAATVAFTIDRQGRVLSSRIVRSSEHALLDAETLATVRRASPFPPPPAGLPGEHFDFTVPIRFSLR